MNIDGWKKGSPFRRLTRENDAFAAALRKAGDTHVTTQHFATDHAYSDKRIELSQAVLKWLAGLPK